MPAQVVSVTIAAGQSLSPAADITGGPIKRIRMPDSWTPANLTFQVATTNVATDFRDLYTRSGTEFVMACVPGKAVPLIVSDFTEEGFIKIRSGTAAAPIVQEADRTFGFVIVK